MTLARALAAIVLITLQLAIALSIKHQFILQKKFGFKGHTGSLWTKQESLLQKVSASIQLPSISKERN